MSSTEAPISSLVASLCRTEAEELEYVHVREIHTVFRISTESYPCLYTRGIRMQDGMELCMYVYRTVCILIHVQMNVLM
jgi:hypothetical protein